ncbi:MAG TPA: matrixin family metalloprotease [Polyangiaceae bacterium]
MQSFYPPVRISIAPAPQAAFTSLPPLVSAPSARPSAVSIIPPFAAAAAPDTKRFVRRLALAAVAIAVVTFGAVGGSSIAHHDRAFGTAVPRTVQNGADERWATGTIDVVLDGSLDDADPGAKDAVAAAFGTWMTSDVGVASVSINRTTDRGQVAHDGVNRIMYGPITIAGHEKDVAVTVSYANASTGAIEEADTVLNSKYSFAVLDASKGDEPRYSECGNKYDVQNVATHEFGHFFGLGEDMNDTTATMFVTSAPCQTHKRALTESDTSAMASLYAGAADADPSKGGAQASCSMASDGARGESAGAMFLFAAALAFMLRRGSGTRISLAPSRRNPRA